MHTTRRVQDRHQQNNNKICGAEIIINTTMTATTTTTNDINNASSNNDYPMADDADWPEAWVMTPDELLTDQSAPNRLSPHNIPVTPVQMRQLGIAYWRMPDVDKYEVRTCVWKSFVPVCCCCCF
jgi:hypothetical protein